ncbi:MAG: asparagine synthase (glutamine-hydrolyzing) [Saprospirales bacterium]|nr:asparagine synthase (glutamine-hydrolyzing) [Saprospirales bacterium]
MCGIAGAYSFKNKIISDEWLQNAATSLNKRGPDNQNFISIGNCSLVHARLSIIDTSESANQPIYDATGRYAIIFNGEIFNYQEIKKELEQKGVQFKTQSDTEVLLYAYIQFGETFLHKLNGFFAFAIFDKLEDSLFIACDRFGIKPLYYYSDEDYFFFGSELKTITQFPVKKEINWSSVAAYFQLNYIPGKNSIFKNIQRLEPGHQIFIHNSEILIKQWYTIPYNALKAEQNQLSYDEQQKKLVELMDDSVRLRLISDVPLGAFLSGGIDSSVVTAMAARHTKHLNTFSIGFEGNSFFDETPYANLVAKHFNTNHTVFKLKNDDLFESLNELLEYTDEPFADSSALLVNILSKFTRKHVTVALSGDAGDELFAGYNKHYGEWQMRNGSWQANVIHLLQPVWQSLPKSRGGGIANKIRQLERFSNGMDLTPAERWWRWCCINDLDFVDKLLNDKVDASMAEIIETRQYFSSKVQFDGTLNDDLLADVGMVLPYDMLVKVDRMSMRNSLEVRVPFLDYRIVEFAFSLPVSSKINGNIKKKIVQDAFREILPKELYNRPKKGFEVPLLQWFKTDLKDKILNDWLSDEYIKAQGIFNVETIQQLKLQMLSNNPGDVHAQIWALIVFQNFWRKYME